LYRSPNAGFDAGDTVLYHIAFPSIAAGARRLGLALSLTLLTAHTAASQTIWLGAGVTRDIQRFAQDAVPNRLDGAATGWAALGALRLFGHLVIVGEWSDAGAIEDVRTITVRIGTRDVPITSTFRHRTRTAAAFAGFGHAIGRTRLAYLVGVASTTVQREFSTNAAPLVLVAPSLPASSPPPLVDRMIAGAAGIDALIRLTSRLCVVAGARFQRIDLGPDVSGWSARSVAGLGVVF
jgi:hypothetical protein